MQSNKKQGFMNSVSREMIGKAGGAVLLFCLCMAFPFALAGPLLAEENAILTGRVLDVDENPVTGAEVFVYTNSNIRRPADYIAPATKSDGEYRVILPPGNYFVVARLRKGSERYGPLLAGDKHSGAPSEIELYPGDTDEEDFVVAGLEETSRLTVKYDTSFFRVEGTLLSKEGDPLKMAYAFANREPGMKKFPDYISPWTAADGKYMLFLPEGTYYFGGSQEFPVSDKTMTLKKVTIDSSVKNNNIVLEK